MPTSGTSPLRPTHRLVRSVLVALLTAGPAVGLAACSGSPPDEPPTASANAPSVQVPAAVPDGLTDLLRQRSRAVRLKDVRAFVRGLDRADPSFVADQRSYFDNLAQLPIGTYRYSLDPGSIVREGDDYWAVVVVTLELAGYDARPVTAPDRYRFSPWPGHPDRFRLSSVSDTTWESRNQVAQQPWDLGPVEVRTGLGVLGIFDRGSVERAPDVVSSVEEGIAELSGLVPYPWSRSVVVYAMSDDTFLGSLDGLPGDPTRLDAIAVPVLSSPESGVVAGTRIVLNPGMLDGPAPQRDRLIRHELTHVVLGSRDDLAPVWLGEGLAEYVSVRPMAPQDRRIQPSAVQAAEDGFSEMPVDDEFNDEYSSEHYALSWWACEYLADSYGEAALWSLLDALGEGADQEQVLEKSFGIDSTQLANRAGRLLLANYRPKQSGSSGGQQTPGGQSPEASPSATGSPAPSQAPADDAEPESAEPSGPGPVGLPTGRDGRSRAPRR